MSMGPIEKTKSFFKADSHYLYLIVWYMPNVPATFLRSMLVEANAKLHSHPLRDIQAVERPLEA